MKHVIDAVCYRDICGELEVQITYTHKAGRPEVRTLRNGDPGWPGDPDELELVSAKADIRSEDPEEQKIIEEWAEDWLMGEGYDRACQIAWEDRQAAEDDYREFLREP